jgi:hypothetical protein
VTQEGYEAQKRDLEAGLAPESSNQSNGPAWIETKAGEIYYFATGECYKASGGTPQRSRHALYYIERKEGQRKKSFAIMNH